MIGHDVVLAEREDGRRVVCATDVGVGRMKRAETIARAVFAEYPDATRMHVVSYDTRYQEYAVVWTPGRPGFRVRVAHLLEDGK
jgi:hypothetical protein